MVQKSQTTTWDVQNPENKEGYLNHVNWLISRISEQNQHIFMLLLEHQT